CFFFQAEDGIRDGHVTGVQTCALPILIAATTGSAVHLEMRDAYTPEDQRFLDWQAGKLLPEQANPEWSAIVRAHTARGVRFRRRSEERRVGKECRGREWRTVGRLKGKG